MNTYSYADRRRTLDAKYRREYELKKVRGIPTSLVPSGPTIAHLERLLALHWSIESINQFSGQLVAHETLALLLRERHPTISRNTRAAVLTVPYTLNAPTHLDDTCLVPALGAERRVHALLRMGWRHSDMRHITDTTHLARGTYKTLVARRWRLIDGLFRERCMTHGPSKNSAIRARERGLVTALAWDDIDSPDEKPQQRLKGDAIHLDPAVIDRLLAGETVASTRDEKAEAMRRWVNAGNSQASLCNIHGWKQGRYYVADRNQDAA